MIDLHSSQDFVNALAPFLRSHVVPFILAVIVPTLLWFLRATVREMLADWLVSLADLRHLPHRLKYDYSLVQRLRYRRATARRPRRRWRR